MLNKIRSRFRADGLSGVARAVLRRLVRRKPVRHPVEAALAAVTARPGFTIVQLGAFTGRTENDPLYEALSRRLRVVEGTLLLVEPVDAYFQELVRNYQSLPGARFENAAVAEKDGEASIYRLAVDPVAHSYPEWLAQLSSLKEERIGPLWDRYEQNPDYKKFYLEHRIKETVRCLTFQSLLERHALGRVDLLQMDVEGYELEILRTINFQAAGIRFVNFESVLLQDRKPEAERLMHGQGYELIDFGQDTFCFLPGDRWVARNHRISSAP